ncbi:MAG: glycosyltransferase family 4 protein [Verrucomicrobia bacterium]|nr:glycosyltransferase family 4 protein [Verrucomicrobiota bacterium]
MRLAFLTHEPFYPPSGGGSAEAVYLVQEMVDRGHKVHVFCPRSSQRVSVSDKCGFELHEFTTWQMGRYTRLRNFKYVLYPFFLARMVERAARTTKFDLIFSQHSISAVAAGRLKRRLGLPVVMNFLDFLTAFMETWPPYLMPPPVLARLERFELNLPRRYQADAVLTISDTLADYFADTGYPRERLRPIYFGYDADLFDPAKAVSKPAPGQPPVVVMHGSLDHHHLGPIAVGALAHVTKARSEVVFRFVGQRTAALAKFLQHAAAAAPHAKLECTGFVPYAEVAAQLASASVGIVPYEESRGVHCAFVAKTVEYLGLGLPTVCTPLRSISSYFRDEPLIRFSGFDAQSFGEKILSWLSEPVERRRALGPPAAQRVKAELDWRVLSGRTLDFVEQVCDPTRAPTRP